MLDVVSNPVSGLQRYENEKHDDDDFVEYDFDNESATDKKKRLELIGKSKKHTITLFNH